jgi:hypothetical protein
MVHSPVRHLVKRCGLEAQAIGDDGLRQLPVGGYDLWLSREGLINGGDHVKSLEYVLDQICSTNDNGLILNTERVLTGILSSRLDCMPIWM